jgi:hypothetical protein
LLLLAAAATANKMAGQLAAALTHTTATHRASNSTGLTRNISNSNNPQPPPLVFCKRATRQTKPAAVAA